MTQQKISLNLCIWLCLWACGWNQAHAFTMNPPNLLESLFRSWNAGEVRTDTEKQPPVLPEVKHLTTASYKGINYVMVKNVSLGFAQAERYCENEFSDPMHLASIRTEDEWHMLANVFGTPYPSEVWLGGTVRRTNGQVFVLHWLDRMSFVYHRFPRSERRRWMTNWRINSHGCITGNLQSNAQGNWSAELTPCTEPRAFICKEAVRQNSPPMEISPSYSLRNLLISLLFPAHPLIPYEVSREDNGRTYKSTTEAPVQSTTASTQPTVVASPLENPPAQVEEENRTLKVDNKPPDAERNSKDRRADSNDTKESSSTPQTKLLSENEEVEPETTPNSVSPLKLPKFTIFSTGAEDQPNSAAPPDISESQESDVTPPDVAVAQGETENATESTEE